MFILNFAAKVLNNLYMRYSLKDITAKFGISPEENIKQLLNHLNHSLNCTLSVFIVDNLIEECYCENCKLTTEDIGELLSDFNNEFLEENNIDSGVVLSLVDSRYDEKINEIYSSFIYWPVSLVTEKAGRLLVFYSDKAEDARIDDDYIFQLTTLLALETEHLRSKIGHSTNKDIYRAVFDNANDGIFLLKDNIIVKANETVCKIFGYDMSELIGKTPDDLSPRKVSSNEDISLNKQGYMNRALIGEPQRFDWIHQKKDGSIFYTEITLSIIYDNDSYDILAIIRDISERMKYENLLKEQSEKACESSRLKSMSLASMSHELRTPLNSIIGFSDLLLDEETTEEEKEMFSRLIQTAGKSLMQLIGDIIDISKIEAGKITIKKSVFNINTFLKDIFMSFQQEKKSQNINDIELKLVLSDNANELKIETDEHRLRQVFNNLLTNSLKFVDVGYIEFGYLSITPGFIQFYVKDTGVGIDYDKRKTIFEQFGQDKLTYNRNKEGTGLGLAISKSFVELLGGNIWLDSEPEKGSTFYFTIPLINNSGVFSGIGMQDIDWSNKTILIADDVKENYLFLSGLLRYTKVNILWAKDGKEAIDISESHNEIDCILMDIRMPVMDGYESLEIIKKRFPEKVIIALTAFSSVEDKESCLAKGFDHYFKKPLKYSELYNVLSNVFS